MTNSLGVSVHYVVEESSEVITCERLNCTINIVESVLVTNRLALENVHFNPDILKFVHRTVVSMGKTVFLLLIV